MKKMIPLSGRMLCFCVMLLSLTFYGQTTSTVTLNYSQRQGAHKQCGLSSCTYFSTFGDETIYSDGTGGSSNTKNARYLFSHPGFTNNQIKKIILEIQISKIYNSTTLDAGMTIKVPNSACNNSIAWSGNVNNETLFNCINTGNSVFDNGIGTPNTSATTFSLVIYDSQASGFPSQTLAYFEPNSTSFTFVFNPYVGGVTIHSAKAHVTYESTPPVNPVPGIPSVVASASSPTSIQLSWNPVPYATSYQIVDCSNQPVTTTTATSHLVTGLTPTYTYGYKVRAVNSAGASGYSTCKYTTTPSGVTGCSNAMTTRTPTGLTGISGGWDGSTIGWNAVTGADAYEVWRCETNTKIADVVSTEYFIPRAQMEPGVTYTYKVRAVDHCSNGSSYFSKFSSCYLHVGVPCQSSPVSVNQLSYEGGETWLRIYWGHSGSANYLYEVYNCETNQLVATTYDNQYQFLNLSPGTQYSYKIRARGCNPPVYNPFSSCITATTQGCATNKTIADATVATAVHYEASNSVSIANSVFESGSSGVVQAANFVVINPDTHYKNGSNIVIKTGECAATSGKTTYEVMLPEYEAVLSEYKFPESEKAVGFGVAVYPNPVKDWVTVTSDVDLKRIAVIAIDGKLVLDKKVTQKTEAIDLSALESGVYLMNVETQNGKRTVEKIIRK